MKFKTNAQCSGCVAAIGKQLNKIMKDSEWNINLNTPDKVLTVSDSIAEAQIIAAVSDAGYQAERLEH